MNDDQFEDWFFVVPGSLLRELAKRDDGQQDRPRMKSKAAIKEYLEKLKQRNRIKDFLSE